MLRITLSFIVLTLPTLAGSSALWGSAGEKWTSTEILPDYSTAGYMEGRPVPKNLTSLKQINVATFGATPDDDTDDTSAFRAALASITEPTVVNIPAGRFIISDRVTITTPKTILKGASRDSTIIDVTTGLEMIDPKPTKNRGGAPTSYYSWSGGFLRIIGNVETPLVGRIAEPAKRGSTTIVLKEINGTIEPGERLRISLTGPSDQSLLRHQYAGDPGNISLAGSGGTIHLHARAVEVDGNRIHLDRTLPCDLRLQWSPRATRCDTSVYYSGIESLTVRFPKHTYLGHFKEVGYNAFNLDSVADCWLRDIHIVNADSGVFLHGYHCTVSDIIFSAPDTSVTRPGVSLTEKLVGHHGVIAGGNYNLIERLDFRCVFFHDYTVSHSIGNVLSSSKGLNVSLDHHKRGPFGNLFTEIDLGKGTRFLKSGGGKDLGRYAGAWNTYWNIRAENSLKIDKDFGPKELNFVGVNPANPDAVRERGYHLETGEIRPRNLYQAQRKRLRRK